MTCPTCRTLIRVAKLQSKIYPRSKPFFRWVCTECSWFDRQWHATEAKALATTPEGGGR